MKKKWFVAAFKANEFKRLEINLLNQKFEYYIPKITTKKINSSPKEVVLFPGYIFVNTALENYSSIKYTMGIKSIIKFGDKVAYMSNKDIKAMEMLEETSKIEPIASQIKLGQEALITKGSLKGNFVKILSLSSRERANVLLNFLGSMRRITIPIKDITL